METIMMGVSSSWYCRTFKLVFMEILNIKIKMDGIAFTCPWNLVICVRGVPAHLNVGLIRKGKLPAITPCNSKPNINAFGYHSVFWIIHLPRLSQPHRQCSNDHTVSLLHLFSALSPKHGSAPQNKVEVAQTTLRACSV